MRERLHKVLAHIGVGSRRDCEELIQQGRISVDGKTVTEMGVQVDARRQSIKVDGRLVKLPPLSYYLLNKPRGVICSMSEEEKGPRAVDFAPKGAGRLHTVGRLDKESEGLIILTNDGDLTERLTHPRHDFPKRYQVLVTGSVPGEAIAKLKKGVWLAEGRASVDSVKILRSVPGFTQIEVELREGKNREIRRVLARVGHAVKELKRVAIGPIELKGLGVGKIRALGEDEVETLREAVGIGGGRAAGATDAPKVKKKPSEQGRKPKAAPKPVAQPVPAARPAPEPVAAKKAPRPKAGFENPIRIVKGKGKAPEEVKEKAKEKEKGKGKGPGKGKGGDAGRAPAEPRREADEPVAEPVFPDEPAAPRPRFIPDEDGVIVVRRPGVRLVKEEE